MCANRTTLTCRLHIWTKNKKRSQLCFCPVSLNSYFFDITPVSATVCRWRTTFPDGAGASLCTSSLWVEREQRIKCAAGLLGEVCAQPGLLAEVAGAESPPFRVGQLYPKWLHWGMRSIFVMKTGPFQPEWLSGWKIHYRLYWFWVIQLLLQKPCLSAHGESHETSLFKSSIRQKSRKTFYYPHFIRMPIILMSAFACDFGRRRGFEQNGGQYEHW